MKLDYKLISYFFQAVLILPYVGVLILIIIPNIVTDGVIIVVTVIII